MAVNSTFDTVQRRDQLAQQLHTAGSLRIGEAAHEWGVHAMTIRRDFDLLVEQGLARRVRGGIISQRGDDFAQRRHRGAAAKEKIAQKLGFVTQAGGVIALDASTTVAAFAEQLTEFHDATIVTNGVPTFLMLRGRPGANVFLTGGEQEAQNDALVGALAENALSHFMISTAIVSTMSFQADHGASENTLAQVSFKRALAAAAGRLVLAVDASKLDTQARFRSLNLTDIDTLVTDLDPTDSRLDAYREAVRQIL